MRVFRQSLPVFTGIVLIFAGCQSIDTSIFGGSFGRNSSAMTGGGAVAGQDYVIGLKPSEAAQQYFASASLSGGASPVTVTPGDDKGTGVVWTDDGGITIPPGTTIEFTNKGCCLDPHLPAPKADEEMQFIKTSCLIPAQLQGTYRNLLRRAAAGDEDVKSNLQHFMWTLRTAGSNDAYATNLTDRQRELLVECADGGSFDGYCQELQRFDGLKKLAMAQVEQVAEKLQVEIGNVTYKVSDLLDPELGKQKVAAHLGELIHMNEYLPIVQSGFNFGELEKGIYTDVKGNGTLSFKAKVANSTSKPFVFYPMDYVAQVGSGQNMQGAFFAAADNTMRQRTTSTIPDEVQTKEKKKCEHNWQAVNKSTDRSMGELPQTEMDKRKALRDEYKQQIDEMREQIKEQILRMNRENGLEYGSVVYMDSDGTIKSTSVKGGNYDWQINRRIPDNPIKRFLGWGDDETVQRTTRMNGKYYVYDGAIPAREVASPWGDYVAYEDGTKRFGGFFGLGSIADYELVPTASWSPPSLPEGAIPLEIVHMHPDYTSFSPEDLLRADIEGIAISVINDSDGRKRERTVVYDSFDESFSSSLGYEDVKALERYHEKIKKLRNDNYEYRCKKCGATR